MLIIACISAPHLSAVGSQAGLWGSLLPAAAELHAGSTGPRIGNCVDHAALAIREGDLQNSWESRPTSDRVSSSPPPTTSVTCSSRRRVSLWTPCSTSTPGKRHCGDSVDDHVAEADQSGDHGPARSASSFSAIRSRSRLLISRTVRTASAGQTSTPWQAPAMAPAIAAIVSLSPPSEAAVRQTCHGSFDAARARQRPLAQIPVWRGWSQSAQRCPGWSGHDHQGRPARSPTRCGGRQPPRQPIRPAADPTRRLGCRAS